MKRPLRIIGAADLHGHAQQLSRLKSAKADLIAFCGDLHNGGTPEDAKPVADALASIGPPVFIVPGNMDPRGYVLDLWRDAGLTVLHAKSCRLGSYGLVGIGGMAVRSPSRIGDLTRFYISEEEAYQSLAQAYREISDTFRRVVLSHQPPRGLRDTIYNGESVGCLGLRRFAEDCQPDLMICGHIHEDRGQARLGSTTVLNVGEMRKGFAAVIELGEQMKVDWIEP